MVSENINWKNSYPLQRREKATIAILAGLLKQRSNGDFDALHANAQVIENHCFQKANTHLEYAAALNAFFRSPVLSRNAHSDIDEDVRAFSLSLSGFYGNTTLSDLSFVISLPDCSTIEFPVHSSVIDAWSEAFTVLPHKVGGVNAAGKPAWVFDGVCAELMQVLLKTAYSGYMKLEDPAHAEIILKNICALLPAVPATAAATSTPTATSRPPLFLLSALRFLCNRVIVDSYLIPQCTPDSVVRILRLADEISAFGSLDQSAEGDSVKLRHSAISFLAQHSDSHLLPLIPQLKNEEISQAIKHPEFRPNSPKLIAEKLIERILVGPSQNASQPMEETGGAAPGASHHIVNNFNASDSSVELLSAFGLWRLGVADLVELEARAVIASSPACKKALADMFAQAYRDQALMASGLQHLASIPNRNMSPPRVPAAAGSSPNGLKSMEFRGQLRWRFGGVLARNSEDDVLLAVRGGEKIRANRVLLAMSSPFFMTMFTSNLGTRLAATKSHSNQPQQQLPAQIVTKISTGGAPSDTPLSPPPPPPILVPPHEYDMADSPIDYTSLSAIVACLQLQSSPSALFEGLSSDFGRAQQLLSVADFLMLPHIKAKCCAALFRSLSVSKCCSVLLAAERHNCPALRSLAEFFAAEHLSELLELSDSQSGGSGGGSPLDDSSPMSTDAPVMGDDSMTFGEINFEMLQRISERCDSPIAVFRAACQWLEANQFGSASPMFGQAMALVPFGKMNPVQLTEVCGHPFIAPHHNGAASIVLHSLIKGKEMESVLQADRSSKLLAIGQKRKRDLVYSSV